LKWITPAYLTQKQLALGLNQQTTFYGYAKHIIVAPVAFTLPPQVILKPKSTLETLLDQLPKVKYVLP
jgi:hypothetical protein